MPQLMGILAPIASGVCKNACTRVHASALSVVPFVISRTAVIHKLQQHLAV